MNAAIYINSTKKINNTQLLDKLVDSCLQKIREPSVRVRLKAFSCGVLMQGLLKSVTYVSSIFS